MSFHFSKVNAWAWNYIELQHTVNLGESARLHSKAANHLRFLTMHACSFLFLHVLPSISYSQT